MRREARKPGQDAVATDSELRQEPVEIRRQNRDLWPRGFHLPPVLLIGKDGVAALLYSNNLRHPRHLDQCLSREAETGTEWILKDRDRNIDRIAHGLDIGDRGPRRSGGARTETRQREQYGAIRTCFLRRLCLGDRLGCR